MQIGILGNNYRDTTLLIVERIINRLEGRGVQVNICPEIYTGLPDRYRSQSHVSELKAFVGNDAFLSVGGDGTFLTSAALIGNREIPILGVNTGRLGFLSDSSIEQLEQSVDDLIAGNVEIERRSVLHVVSSDSSIKGRRYALNEIAVLKQDHASMISVEATVDGRLLNIYQADGLIISTPTGSTAYNLSVGGPLLVPESPSFVISPVATHSLTVRPLVIPDTWRIHLRIGSRSGNYLISIDGRSQTLQQLTELTIERARYDVLVVHTKGSDFMDTLRKKLLWGSDTRN
ncbi:MAG: NAD kinase [Paludibacteraceae bacterium]|nr:NAD kinase [Paludibacteraceae bacterium]